MRVVQLADRCWGLNRGREEVETNTTTWTTFRFFFPFILSVCLPLCNYTSCLEPVGPFSLSLSLCLAPLFYLPLFSWNSFNVLSPPSPLFFLPKKCTCQVTTPVGLHTDRLQFDLNVISSVYAPTPCISASVLVLKNPFVILWVKFWAQWLNYHLLYFFSGFSSPLSFIWLLQSVVLAHLTMSVDERYSFPPAMVLL